MIQLAKIKSIQPINHNVLHFVVEKPHGFNFTPGQAVDVAINKDGWLEEFRPFTLTSLPEDPDFEFIIKTYPVHQGVTNELLALKANDELILGDVYGVISYKGEGVFVAGGAGITPFISIFKDLKKKINSERMF